ncbi:MAG: TatD family deoxyribonuclease [Bacteroidetes bacterium]|nr:TatD family deoxyribonuclease [Bacteroidota bacterium]
MHKLIDTHAHLYLSDFESDSFEMLERAKRESVGRIYLPAIDSTTHESMIRFESSYPASKAMMGVHPCSVKANYQEELDCARGWWEKRPFVAVGEIGLDFYWDRTFEQEQYIAFRAQIDWALDKKVPVVIHSRQSTLACIEVLKEYKHTTLKGIFHCFSGSLEEARAIIKQGFLLGIGGVLTYNNAGVAAVVEQLPLDHMVLETDAPYLAPVPHRGKRNESAYLKIIAEKIASLKRVSIDEVAEITSRNAALLFGPNSTFL